MAVVVGLEDMVLGLQRKQKGQAWKSKMGQREKSDCVPVGFEKQSLVRPAERK